MDDEKLDRLLGRLKGETPDTSRLEIGFEARVMARIRARREDQTPFFFIAWKLAPAFLALFLALGALWYAATMVPNFDHIASLGSVNDDVQLVAYMAGD